MSTVTIHKANCVGCLTELVFNPPVVVPAGEKLEPKCRDCVSPEELEKQRQCADEATTFVMAGLALDMYTAILMKNGPALTRVTMRMKQVIDQDPSYINRFRAAQASVMKNYIEEAQNSQPPGSLL